MINTFILLNLAWKLNKKILCKSWQTRTFVFRVCMAVFYSNGVFRPGTRIQFPDLVEARDFSAAGFFAATLSPRALKHDIWLPRISPRPEYSWRDYAHENKPAKSKYHNWQTNACGKTRVLSVCKSCLDSDQYVK